jgi:hypothetical protein
MLQCRERSQYTLPKKRLLWEVAVLADATNRTQD